MKKRFYLIGLCEAILILFLVAIVTAQEPLPNGGYHYAPEPAASVSNPGWTQVNESGFGDPANISITSLEVFKG